MIDRKVRALSIRQPWAWLIAHGYKDVENRTWKTNFRGVFLIHAGLRFDHQGYAWVRERVSNIVMPSVSSFARGGIVGSAQLENCVTTSNSPWFFGPYGFVLVNAQPRGLILKARGKLGFFEVVYG